MKPLVSTGKVIFFPSPVLKMQESVLVDTAVKGGTTRSSPLI